ncbi:MAG: ABC transporter permease [Microbacterium gubbeenense]|uniref:ABC transporter permease n=3 Tax=Microbacterium gubbeenense TaxID=159896 RepID=UPI00040731AA|nr:ABC transporter permease [Microbacterium gubbeenense]
MTTTMTPTTRMPRGLRTMFRDAHVTRLAVVLVALLAFFAIVKWPNFSSVATWQSMAMQFPEFGLLALGVMLTMVLGGIDLSVVGTANMTAIATAMLMLKIAPEGSASSTGYLALGAGVAFSLVVGAVAGAINGFLVAKVKIPAILVTLGTFELYTGIALVISGGKPISGMPPEYAYVMGSRIASYIPMVLIIFVIGAVIVWYLMNRTAFGTKLYMLGSNETAANFTGLKTTSLIVRTYTISGVFAASAGLVMLANYNSAKADYGSTYTLLAILIVVLGGINPNGGTGRLAGVVLAVVVLQVLSSLLNTFPGVSNFYRPLIWGGVLLLVIIINQWDKRGNLTRMLRWKGTRS